ncbi:MAG: response regulator [Spirochaetes bacterium]|nr:response regulator [Spirochaetota bacterium]
MTRLKKSWGETPRTRILVVDDEKLNRDLMKAYLASSDYDILTAGRGVKALELLDKKQVDLVLLDILMPGMQGIEVLKQLRKKKKTKDTPVIILTALKDQKLKIQGLESGANDFLLKPIDKIELLVRIENLLKLKKFNDYLKDHNIILEKEVRQRTHQLVRAYKKLDTALTKVKNAYIETILRLTRAAEYKDESTATHIQRMSHYALLIAQHLNLSSRDQEILFHAAPMHDIGKIGIPDHILLKPAPLTKKEFEIIKKHTLIGARILSGSESPIIQAGATIAISHHEQWNGHGYPKGLKGDRIPLFGRIIFLADVYDALRSRRPYKKELPHAQVLDIITRGDNRINPDHFDPELFKLFIKINNKFNNIFNKFRD